MAKLFMTILLLFCVSFSLYMITGYDSGWTLIITQFADTNSFLGLLDNWKFVVLPSVVAAGLIARFLLGSGGGFATSNVVSFIFYIALFTGFLSVVLLSPLGFLQDPSLPAALKLFMGSYFFISYAVIGYELVIGREA